MYIGTLHAEEKPIIVIIAKDKIIMNDMKTLKNRKV